MKTYYTYILLSLKDNGYYFGYSENLENRLEYHNKGLVTSTRNRIPFSIHYFETFSSKTEALKREKFFKSYEGRLWLIANNIITAKKI